MSETTTTDPTPETSKDRQLVYWQQQACAADRTIESLRDEIEQLRTESEARREDAIQFRNLLTDIRDGKPRGEAGHRIAMTRREIREAVSDVLGELTKSSRFSDFIRNASEDEKREVYEKVIDDANEAQRNVMEQGSGDG